MIPRPVELRAQVSVDFEHSSGPWSPTEFRLTYVQLLSLCSVLLFCLLLHVVRSLRLRRTVTGSASSSCRSVVGDKELCAPLEESQPSEKSASPPSSESAPSGSWRWVDALLGRDAEEEEAVVNAARSMINQTHHQLAWSVQNDPAAGGYKNSTPYQQRQQQQQQQQQRQQQQPRPPISMAKLIMSRHVRSSHPISYSCAL